MKNFLKGRSNKSGLGPGSFVFIGDKKVDKVRVNIFDYNETYFEEKSVFDLNTIFQYSKPGTISWIDVEGLNEVDKIENICKIFNLHPLVIEDILNTDQRAKLEDFDDYVYLVVRMIDINETTYDIITEQVSIIFNKNYVITFQEGYEGDCFTFLRERLRQNKGKVRKLGTDYLVYSFLDSIVDNYFSILEVISDQIEFLEEDLISKPETTTLSKLHSLKREMLILRKSVWPLREVLNSLEKEQNDIIDEQTKPYYRDVYDHTIHIIDTIETFRDMLSGMLDIYLSSISNKINEVMKVLTIITTIFIPLSFIAGLYGMNFNTASPFNMPELNWEYGYMTVVIVMILLALSLIFYFKKKKWL